MLAPEPPETVTVTNPEKPDPETVPEADMVGGDGEFSTGKGDGTDDVGSDVAACIGTKDLVLWQSSSLCHPDDI